MFAGAKGKQPKKVRQLQCQEQYILITSHIAFRDCRVHTFSDNLSRNSSIRQEDHALCHELAFHWKQDLHCGGSLGCRLLRDAVV